MSMSIKVARAGGMPGNGRQIGDPGLFGFLGGLAKKAVGSIPFVGGVAEAALDAFTGGTPSAPPIPRAQVGRRPDFVNPPFGGAPGVGFGGPIRVGAGERAPARAQAMNGVQATTKLACPGGFHPNKADYFLRDGTFVPEGSRCVKNRRRNPLNPRALRKAVGRIDAGKVWQSKLHEIETSKFTKAGNRKD